MYEYDKCEITTVRGETVAIGHILEYKSDSMKIRTRDIAVLSQYQPVIVYIMNNQKGECKFQAETLTVGQREVTLTNVRFLSAVQKRNNTRVSKQMKFTIRYKMEGDREIKLKEPVEIMMLNISAQGMYFNAEADLEPGFTFPLLFRETRKPIHLVVRIIRKEKYHRSNNYGCMFDIDQKDMDEIYKFVLREQIEQRRKKVLF